MAVVRPIDANAFIADLEDEAVNLFLNGLKGTPRDYKFLYDIVDRVGEQPTLTDYEPVIHAYWMDGAYCSNCRASKPRPCAAYLEPKANTRCHVCGAKMDAKETNK